MSDHALEPERYELAEPPLWTFRPTRREVVRAMGAGLAILCLARAAASGQRGGREDEPDELGAWLHVGEDGTVTACTGKVEVGQGIRTSLTQAVAEELALSPASVRLVMGDTDLVPYDRGTFGSRTTPTMSPLLRRAAAAAREVLLELAAERLGVAVAALGVRGGRVEHAESGRGLGFGELTGGRELVRTIRADLETTPPEAWRVCGRPLPKVEGRAIVTGAHRYAADVARPGMLFGKVLRPPAFGARLVSVELAGAEALPGVVAVREGDFVGVAAPNAPTAARALAAVRAEWERTEQISHRELFTHLQEHATDGGGRRGREGGSTGSVTDGLASAEGRLVATYTVAYIAHAPLEPRAAVAEWTDGALAVWTGTQRPFGVRSELARAFGVDEERVRVRVPDTGSGYGGKHTGEAAVEAARLALAAGRPVKVAWTREEEFAWAYLRPAGVITIESGFRADGTLTAWRCTNVNSGGSALEATYAIPNQELAFRPSDSPLRQGSYRALAATANVFARETHVDEIAAVVGADPLELRLRNLEDERQRRVLEAAAERFGWTRARAAERGADRGIGLACGFDKGGYVATCAEVSLSRRGVRVERVTAAFECGKIVNPDGLENQVVGCLVQGMGGALFEAIEFSGGRITNGRFSIYRVPRFSDVPPIDVVLLDRPDVPSAGAGEAPIIAIAPAIGNAIADAGGGRRRGLPLA